MKIKRFVASDMRQAIRSVSKELGPDAVILSNAKTADGIELVAAVDYDETLFRANGNSYESAAVEDTDDTMSGGVAAGTHDTGSADDEAAQFALTGRATDSQANAGGDLLLDDSMLVDAPEPADRQPATQGERPPSALKDLRSELGELRSMMEAQISELTWGERARRHPLRSKLIRYLTGYGFDPELCRREADRIADKQSFEEAWRSILFNISKALPVVEENLLERGGVLCLVGPTGVGKTTTIAKLAARYSLRNGSKNVALITMDNYRIGAHEQLRTYGRILGIDVHVAKNAGALMEILDVLEDKKLILVDTAGLGQRDERLVQQLEMMQSALPSAQNILVMSAATQPGSFAQIVKAYQRVPLAGCILTKIDEAVNIGGALSAMIKFQLPIAFISNGQRVPEDMQPAKAGMLLKQAISLAQRTPAPGKEEAVETAPRGNTLNVNV